MSTVSSRMPRLKHWLPLIGIVLFIAIPVRGQNLTIAPPAKQINPKISSRLQKTSGARKPVVSAKEVVVILEPTPGETSAVIDSVGIVALGGKVEAVSTHLMRVRLPIASLEAAAQVEGVHFIRPPQKPHTQRTTTQGVSVMNASSYHTGGITGAGTSVAIIDGGFVGANWLPEDMPETWRILDYTTVGNDSIYSGDSAHGTACAEIIYDIAPGAELRLWKVGDLVDLENAKDLAIREGVDIISHSMSWLGTGWGDGQGLACDIVNDAADNGILWVNSAGNYAQNQYTALWSDSDADGWHNVESEFETIELEEVESGRSLRPTTTCICTTMILKESYNS